MSLLFKGDCLEEMKNIDDNSVDLIFCDLPYGQTSCKWDIIIEWEPLWEQIMRIKKLNTPIFFTTTTKFGVEIINNAPKKCPFRYDLVWVKSASAGFLSAKKMPMRKHEMLYVFYEKLPFYDLSSHTHKFIKQYQDKDMEKSLYGKMPKTGKDKESHSPQYDPPLPVSVVKEEPQHKWVKGATDIYGGAPTEDSKECGGHQQRYDPPLPVSVVKEDCYVKNKTNDVLRAGFRDSKYDPPLPTSVVKEVKEGDICKHYNAKRLYYYDENGNKLDGSDGTNTNYDPPLPDSLLEIKSTRGKHSTEKPVALMEWVLKYFSKEGDVVLDPTMGSGSTGVACKNMKRNFIGIEKDPEIFEVAVNRIEN